MKNLKIGRVLSLLISFWFVGGLGQAAELGVVDLAVFYQKKVNSLRQELDKQIATEHRRYLVEVQQSFEKFRKMGKLGPALLAEREIEFLKKTISETLDIPAGPDPKEFAGTPRLKERRLLHDANLVKITKRYESEHRKAAEKLIELLQEKVKSLTREGKLAEAQEAQQFADGILEEFPPLKEDGEPEESLVTRIADTRWDYYDVRVHAKDPAKLEIRKDFTFSLEAVTGKWKVVSERKREIEFSASAWPSNIEVTISDNFKKYEGKYLADGTRRFGKLKGRIK